MLSRSTRVPCLPGVSMTHLLCMTHRYIGKGAADGCSRVVSQGSRSLALQGENSGSESRGLFELLAAKRPNPSVPRHLKDSLRAVSQHLFVYAGPADGSAFADCHAAAGYRGSSKDHHYTMSPQSRGAAAAECDEGSVQHTNRPCPCDKCLSGDVIHCSVTRLFKNEAALFPVRSR